LDLGFRLEERIGLETCTIVSSVQLQSPALEKGIKAGYVLKGINYERFISHAHSVATLKYIKRPVTIRFKRDGRL